MTKVVAELWHRFEELCPEAAADPDRLVTRGRLRRSQEPVHKLPDSRDPTAVDAAARMLVETGAGYWGLCLEWLEGRDPGEQLRARDDALLAEHWELSSRAEELRRQIRALQPTPLRIVPHGHGRRPMWRRWWRRRR